MFIGTPGRHLRLSSSPNGTPWHYRATLTPIIVAQRYWPDIFTHFTNPFLTQKPRLFSTSLQARTLRRHLSPLSSPNDVHRHSRATFKPIIVAQRYSQALPGDTFAHYRCPTVLLGTTGRHFPAIIVAQRCWPDIFTHFTNPSLTQKPRLFTTSLQAALPGNI